MPISLKILSNRFYRIANRLTAILLLAVFLTAIVPTFSAANLNHAPEGMVFCPLSRRFQPINPPDESKKTQPFSSICAATKTKEFLVVQIFSENLFGRFSLDKTKLDDLAFDVLAHGKSALKDLPKMPELPSENLAGQIGASSLVVNNYDYKFDWNQTFQFSSPTLLARPPTIPLPVFSVFAAVRSLNKISRRIAPRAPPVRS